MPQYSSAPKPPISAHSSPQLSKWLSEGLTLHEIGKLTEAKDFYRKILTIKPDHCEALQLLGTIEIQTGNYAQAVEILTNALLVDPEHALTQNNLGVAFESLKQFDAAIACYNRAIHLLPDYAEAYFNRGNALMEQHQYSAAQKSFNQAISLVPTYSMAYYKCAITLYRQGELQSALTSIDKAIALNLNYDVIYHDRGIMLLELKQFQEAIISFNRAIALNPNYGIAYSNRGNALLALNNIEEAINSYDRAISLFPTFSDAYYNRGKAYEKQRKFDAAIASFDKAIELNPGNANAHCSRGFSLTEQKKYDSAIDSYNKAINLEPNNSIAYCNRGFALYEKGEMQAAIESYDKSLAIDPNFDIAHNDRGLVFFALKQFQASITSFDKAIELNPNYGVAYSNRGNALLELNNINDAIASYDKAIAVTPTYADAYFNRGNAYEKQRKFDAAIASFDKAIELNPDHAKAYCNRGFSLRELCQELSAKESLLKSLSINPDQAHAKWALTLLNIPILSKDVLNLEESRGQFLKGLNELDYWFDESRLKSAFEAVGCIQPFYISYQDFNNREILSRYGAMCNRLMLRWKQLNNLENKFFEKKKKIQIGIVDFHISNHSVWNAITKGVVSNLDPDKFDIHIFFLGKDFDQETKIAKSYATSFTQDKTSLLDWSNSIIEKNIEVLIYPEIGMQQLTTQLASMRLAPVQVVTWGHPETSGLPSIDYYLSSQLFERINSQDLYSEKLIELPNLGCHYSRLAVMPSKLDLKTLGIDSNQPILLCPGILFKYMSQYDWVLSEIVKRIGKSQLIFFSYEEKLTAIFKERLKKSFEERNLKIEDHVIFVPWLNREDFYGLLNSADIFLDTIGFSGFNTAMQAVDCLLPIVTLEGQFMRGKFASGILMRMGMSDLIAHTIEEYIELAVRLVQNKEFHKKISLCMNNSRDILYEDKDPIRALETFLINTCRPESNSDRNIF